MATPRHRMAMQLPGRRQLALLQAPQALPEGLGGPSGRQVAPLWWQVARGDLPPASQGHHSRSAQTPQCPSCLHQMLLKSGVTLEWDWNTSLASLTLFFVNK